MDKSNEINYELIKYFIAVADKENISYASRELGITQPALSLAMKNLESELGLKLFNRTTKGVILTKEGREFYKNVIRGNDILKEGIIKTLRIKNYGQTENYKLYLSSIIFDGFISYCLKDILNEFPNINFEFTEYDNKEKIMEDIQNGKLGLIVRKVDSSFAPKIIESKQIITYHFGLAFNDKIIKLKEDISLNDLKKFPIIFKKRTGKNDNSFILSDFPNYIICTNDKDCLELTKKGIGIGIVAHEVAKSNGLKTLDIIKPIKRTLAGYYNYDDKIGKRIVEIIKEKLL